MPQSSVVEPVKLGNVQLVVVKSQHTARMNITHYTPLLLTNDVALHFLWLVTGMSSKFELLAPKLHLHTLKDTAWLTMSLAFNSEHIIYYHMDAIWSVGLAWTYLAHPNYLVCQMLGPCHLFISWYSEPNRASDLSFFLCSLLGGWAI